MTTIDTHKIANLTPEQSRCVEQYMHGRDLAERLMNRLSHEELVLLSDWCSEPVAPVPTDLVPVLLDENGDGEGSPEFTAEFATPSYMPWLNTEPGSDEEHHAQQGMAEDVRQGFLSPWWLAGFTCIVTCRCDELQSRGLL
jgi:hypothetical protein